MEPIEIEETIVEETPVATKPMAIQYEKDANKKVQKQKVNKGYNEAHAAKYKKHALKK